MARFLENICVTLIFVLITTTNSDNTTGNGFLTDEFSQYHEDAKIVTNDTAGNISKTIGAILNRQTSEESLTTMETSVLTQAEQEKRVAAYNAVMDDGQLKTTSLQYNVPPTAVNMVPTITPSTLRYENSALMVSPMITSPMTTSDDMCGKEKSFCDLLRNVLNKTITPSMRQSTSVPEKDSLSGLSTMSTQMSSTIFTTNPGTTITTSKLPTAVNMVPTITPSTLPYENSASMVSPIITSPTTTSDDMCGKDKSFCDLLRDVLNRTISPPTQQSTSVPEKYSTIFTTNPGTKITTSELDCESDKTFCDLLLKVLNNTIAPSREPRSPTILTANQGFIASGGDNTSQSTTTISVKNSIFPLGRFIIPPSTIVSTTENFVDMMKDVISRSCLNCSEYFHWKELMQQLNSYNGSNVNTTDVNNILHRLEKLMNSSTKITFEDAGRILLNVSNWTNSDKTTMETSCRIISKMMESLQNNASIASHSIIRETMQSILTTMTNILTSSMTKEVSFSSTAVDVITKTVDENVSSSLMISTSGGSIVLSHQLFISKTVRISTVVYHSIIGDNLGGSQNFKGAEVVSNVVAVTLEEVAHTAYNSLPVNKEGAIIITLHTDIRKREKKRICTYWNFKINDWASDGGKMIEKNETHTTCMFDHLTNFAVLVLYYDVDVRVSVNQENILRIITTIGCSISITCLGMTIVVFVYLKLMAKETIMIHGNLSFALICGQVALVASDDAINNEVACKVVAMILHYFFLSAFTWMMVEGIALYLSCTQELYNHGDMRLKYCFLGWVIPLVIVIISIGAEFPNYGDGKRNSCWLSTDDGLIWAFMGPMLIIITFNVFVMGLVIKVFLSLQSNSRKSEAAKIRGGIRAMVFLLPLLGITWILSVLVPLHQAFHYLFVIGNSLQGMMIFFLHCICNEEIRKKFIEKRKRLSSTHKTFADATDLAVVVKKRKREFCDVQLELPSTDRKYAWVS